MELSMYTTYALSQKFSSPVEAFRHFYNKGVRFGDIVDKEFSEYPMHLYCEYLKEAGICPDALVAIIDIASFDERIRESAIATVKGYIDQMEKLSLSLVMLAPKVKFAKSKDEKKRMQELLISGCTRIAEYAKGSGIKVAIENQSSLVRADSKMEEIRYILDCVPQIGYVLDCGNYFCIGEDVLKAYKLLSDRLVRVHAKDWVFDPYGSFSRENMPRFNGIELGKGLIPMKEIIQNLREDKFNGKVVLEVNAGVITLDMLDKSVDFLRNEINI